MRIVEDEPSVLETEDLRFLALCAALLLAALAVRALVYVALRPWRAATPAPFPLGRYDVAMLTGGFGRVVAAALAGLADAGAVTLHPGASSEIRPAPQAPPPRDPVQAQVLGLVPGCPNGQRLAEAFSRTAVATELKSKLVSSGIMLPHRWRFVLGRWFTGALFVVAMAATVAAQWGEGPQDEFAALLFLELIMWAVSGMLCRSWFPLTMSRQGEALVSGLQQTVQEISSAGRTGDAEHDVADVPGAEGWRLEPGWADSPAGRVALKGWDEYRDRWGQPIPLEFWAVLPGNVIRTAEEHRRRSLLYRTLGVVCGVLAIPCAVLTFSVAVWAGPFWLLLASAGARCATLARKHGAAARRVPPHVVHGPGVPYTPRPGPSYPYRPGVLYLRSFAHHDAPLERTAPWQNVKTALLGSRTSYVEELVHVLGAFGPPVAIGNPGAALPALGPAQYFVPPGPGHEGPGGPLERWQAEVLRLMDGSALVVVAAGLGEGLLWEFRQAASRLPPHRLVVVVPLDHAEYGLFREHAGGCFRRGLPADTREPDRRGETGHALIYFEHDWTPRFVGFADHPLLQLHLGRVATRFSVRRYRNQIAHAMYPVFRANGARWPGTEIPVPFGRAARQRVVTGVSLGFAGILLVVGGPLLAYVLSLLL